MLALCPGSHLAFKVQSRLISHTLAMLKFDFTVLILLEMQICSKSTSLMLSVSLRHSSCLAWGSSVVLCTSESIANCRPLMAHGNMYSSSSSKFSNMNLVDVQQAQSLWVTIQISMGLRYNCLWWRPMAEQLGDGDSPWYMVSVSEKNHLASR